MKLKQSGKVLNTAIMLIISILTFNCHLVTKERDCKRFKTGQFIYHLKGSDNLGDLLISRYDSVQTETVLKTGQTQKLSIKWTDSCSYNLTLLETNYPIPDSIKKVQMSSPIKTEILYSTSDYYLFKSTSGYSSRVLIDTIFEKR